MGLEREGFDVQVMSSLLPYWWMVTRRMMLTAQTLVEVLVPRRI